MEMVTTDGQWNIEFSTGEDCEGNGSTEPVLAISRRTYSDAELGRQEEWEYVRMVGPDQLIQALGIEA